MRAQQSSETLSKELSNPNASLISCYSKATMIAATGQVMAVNIPSTFNRSFDLE